MANKEEQSRRRLQPCKTGKASENHKPFPLFVRGVRAQVKIESEAFRGLSLYIFAQLLNHIFNLKVQMNSYVEMIVIDAATEQEVYQCVQNVGGKKLL